MIPADVLKQIMEGKDSPQQAAHRIEMQQLERERASLIAQVATLSKMLLAETELRRFISAQYDALLASNKSHHHHHHHANGKVASEAQDDNEPPF